MGHRQYDIVYKDKGNECELYLDWLRRFYELYHWLLPTVLFAIRIYLADCIFYVDIYEWQISKWSKGSCFISINFVCLSWNLAWIMFHHLDLKLKLLYLSEKICSSIAGIRGNQGRIGKLLSWTRHHNRYHSTWIHSNRTVCNTFHIEQMSIRMPKCGMCAKDVLFHR